jgi:TRAP-type C4-dicarboxylate transport system substrate-binding protein
MQRASFPRIAVLLGAALALVSAGLVGCRGASDKAGGERRAKPVVLKFANYNFAPLELAPFAAEVERRSHGSLRIAFHNHWRDGQRDQETKLIHDVQAGHADLGYVGSRAWDTVGVTSFDALHLPFLIDSYTLEQSVLESALAKKMLQGLEPLGLVGVGILPGELRRIVGVRKPVVRAADFRGLTWGTTQARAAAETVRALGARPVPFLALPSVRRFGGFDFPVTSFEGNAYDAQARYITANLAFWPRPLVLFMSRRVAARLTRTQLALLRSAAEDTIPAAVGIVERRERKAMAALCGRGSVRFVHSTTADLAAIRSAVASVRARTDAETRAYASAIERTKRRLDAPAQKLPACPPVSSAGGAIPDGTYENTTTAADARRAKVPASDMPPANLPIHHRLVIRGRRFALHSIGRDGTIDLFEGTYSSYHGKVRFETTGETLLPVPWSFDGRTLRFFDLPFHGTGYWGAVFSPPWTKTH